MGTPSRQSPSFPMTLSTTTSMELTMGPLPTKGNAQDLLSWEQMFVLYLLSRRTFCLLKRWATRASRSQSDGVEIAENFVEYSYLDGRVKHFKDVGGTHGSTFGNANTKAVLEEVILGRVN